MNKTTLLDVLAVATVLGVELAIVADLVHAAEANPCSQIDTNSGNFNGDIDQDFEVNCNLDQADVDRSE